MSIRIIDNAVYSGTITVGGNGTFDGNVGIGTTSPSAKLHVADGGGFNVSPPISIKLSHTGFTTTLPTNIDQVSAEIQYIRSYVGSIWKNFLDLRVRGDGGISTNQGGSNIRFFTNSTEVDSLDVERMRIDDAGNVGIGVIPEVGGNTWQHIQFGGTGNIIARKADTGLGAMFANNYYINSSNVDSAIQTGEAARVFMSAGDIRFDNAQSVSADAQVTFNTRMKILSNGNVGIGTSNPGAKLDVLGDVSLTGTASPRFKAVGNSSSGYPGLLLSNTTQEYEVIVRGNDANKFQIRNTTASTNLLTITSTGNVGIGTTSPSEILHLSGTGEKYLKISSTDQAAGIKISSDNTGEWKIYQRNSFDGLEFEYGGTPAMTFLANRNVGIGTTSPAAKLHVSAASSNSQLTLERTGSATGKYNIYTNTNNLVINNVAANTYPLTILNSGNVGIGTTAPIGKLHVDTFNTSNNALTIQASNWTARTYGIGIDSSSNLSFYDNFSSLARLIITSAGNVGIGTTSPDAPLTVTNDSVSSYIINVNMADDVDGGGFYEATGGMELYLKDTSGTGQVKLTSSGSSYLNGGNVGIGTTSPRAKLEVFGENFAVTNSGRSIGGLHVASDSNDGAGTYSGGISFAGPGSGASAISGVQGTNDGDTQGLAFFTHGSGTGAADSAEAMRISHDGNVGIGTTSPDAKLDVTSTIPVFRLTDNQNKTWTKGETMSEFQTFTIDGSGIGQRVVTNIKTVAGSAGATMSGELAFEVSDYNSNTSEAMRIDQNGNVGIGTTTLQNSSGYKTLSISGSAGGQIAFQTAGVGKHYIYGTATDFNIYNSQAGSLTLHTNASARLTINSSGNVGIGTTSPVSHAPTRKTLVVADTVNGANVEIWGNQAGGKSILQSVGGDTYVGNLANGTGSGTTYITSGAGNTYTTILANGNVGIGTTSPNRLLEISAPKNSSIFRITSETSDSSWIEGDEYGAIEFYSSDTSASGPYVVGKIASIADGASVGFGNRAGLGFFVANGASAIEKLRIDESGNVGIGTTSPDYKLDVNGSFHSSNITIADGIYHEGDTNNYFQFATDTQIFATSGAERMRLHSTGDISFRDTSANEAFYWDASSARLGIGTTSPAYDLTVKKSTDSSIIAESTSVSQSATLSSYNSATTNAIQMRSYGGSVSGTIFGNSIGGANAVWSNGDNKFLIGTIGSTPVVFGTSNAERMRITSTGKVGIGTSNPATPLDVVSNSSATGITLRGRSSDNIGTLNFADNAGNVSSQVQDRNGAFWLTTIDASPIVFNTSSAERMRIDPAGGVGIGTTNPSRTLHVVGGDGGTGTHIAQFEGRSGVVGMYVRGDGNVGIGTTSPERALHIDANGGRPIIQIDKGGDKIFSVGTGTSANDDDNTILQMYDEGTEKIRLFTVGDSFFNGGNVGIGTTNPSQKLSIATIATSANPEYVEFADTSNNSSWVSGQDYGGLQWLMSDTTGIGPHVVAQIKAQNTHTGAAGNGEIVFSTSTYNVAMSEKMRITSDGRVGIGTNSPSTRLMLEHSNNGAVGGTIRIKDRDSQQAADQLIGAIEFESQDASVPTGGVSTAIKAHSASGVGGSYLTLSTTDIGTSTLDERLRIDSAGNVGIGTTSPSTILHASDSNGAVLRLERKDKNVLTGDLLGGIETYRDDDDGAYIQTFIKSYAAELYGRHGYMVFGTNNLNNGDAVERMRIDSAGNVGIGTTSPGAQLHIGSPEATPGGTAGTVDRFIIQPYSNTGGPYIFKARTVSGSEDYLDLYYGSNQIISYGLGGNVGIGTSSPGKKLHVKESTTATYAAYIENSIAGGDYLAMIGDAGDNVFEFDSGGTGGEAQMKMYSDGVLKNLLDANGSSYFNGGNVGIGTTSPLSILTVGSSTGNSRAAIYGEAYGAAGVFDQGIRGEGSAYGILGISTGSGVGVYGSSSSGYGGYFTSSTGYGLLVANGNVGIGTTNPGAKLEVAGASGAISGTGMTYLNNSDDAFSLVINNAGTSSQNDRGVFEARVGASSVFRINNSGNVGIGTTSPNARLEIGSAYGDAIILKDGRTATSGEYEHGIRFSHFYNYVNGLYFQHNDYFGVAKDKFLLKVGNGTKMVVDYTGNVGIGTTNPLSKLHVQSSTSDGVIVRTSTNVEPFIAIQRNSGSNGVAVLRSIDGGHLYVDTGATGAAQSTKMTITSGGNVGIGTTNPAGKLTITDAAFTTAYDSIKGLFFDNSNITSGAENFGAGIEFGKLGLGGNLYKKAAIIPVQSEADSDQMGISFFVANVSSQSSPVIEAMRVDYGGNVGIGTTNPGAKLDVDGAIRSKGTSANIDVDARYGAFRFHDGNLFYGGFYNDSDLNPGPGNAVDLVTYVENGDYYITTGSTTSKAVTVKKGGNVGINTTNPATQLDVDGEITVSDTANFNGGVIAQALPQYSDNNDALIAGEPLGTIYYTNVSGDGILKVVI